MVAAIVIVVLLICFVVGVAFGGHFTEPRLGPITKLRRERTERAKRDALHIVNGGRR